MRRLTPADVERDYGGVLPPDATLRAEGEPPARAATRSKTLRPRGARGERFALLNAFIDTHLADLTGGESKVWMILFRDTKAATGTARTGQTDLARRAGLQPRMIRYALNALEKKGLLRVVRRGRLNAGPSIYRVYTTVTA